MKRPITFIVVDDDAAAIDRIATLVRPFQHWLLIASFTEPAKALVYLNANHVDFVLLDMEMPVIDGRAFMMQMPKEVQVILYTAHDEYATDGFDYDAVDFLKKPVSVERFNKAMEKMVRALKRTAADGAACIGDYYYFMMRRSSKSVRSKINLDELVYVEARDDRTYFYLAGEMEPDGFADGDDPIPWDSPGKHLGRESPERLGKISLILGGSSFKRVHRSLILNIRYLDTFDGHEIQLKGFRTRLRAGKRENYPDFYALVYRDYVQRA